MKTSSQRLGYIRFDIYNLFYFPSPPGDIITFIMGIKQKKIGAVLLAIGVFMLVMGLFLALTVGTVIVPILITSSIFVNTAGLTLLGKGFGGKHGVKTQKDRPGKR